MLNMVYWKDTGCELVHACLECHLPRCAEERRNGKRKIRMKLRAKSMSKMRRAGYNSKQISIVFGVCERTVQRALKRDRCKIAALPSQRQGTKSLL